MSIPRPEDHWTGWKCPALMQMWEPRSAHVSRILAWGILDQDNTSCLVQGIPAPEDLDMVPLGPILAVDIVECIIFNALICYGNPYVCSLKLKLF